MDKNRDQNSEEPKECLGGNRGVYGERCIAFQIIFRFRIFVGFCYLTFGCQIRLI